MFTKTYGSNALTHPFYPFKFDLGGLLAGAFVGFGALLLVPKIMHLLTPELAPYGSAYGSPYTRSTYIQNNLFLYFLRTYYYFF